MQVLTRRLLTRVWFACALLLPGVVSAEIFFERQNTFDETGRRHALLMVLGHIHPGEEVVFARALRTIGSEKLRLIEDSVILNSWGGNRWAAFDMGRLVRKKRLATLVPSGAQCDSACVWVLVGGVCRAAIGHVSLHRVQFDMPLNPKRIDIVLRNADSDLKRYLTEMDVPLEMWQVAHHTATWSITPLSDIRKRVWGLFTTLHGEQERRFTEYIKRTGANKKEIVEKLKLRERQIRKSLGEDDDYREVPCSEQLLLVEPQLAEADVEESAEVQPPPADAK